MSKVRFCTLFSGSSANSFYIEANGRGILIDAGAGIKKIGLQLNDIGSDLGKVEAIFITHEHTDHISGLSSILRKYKIPVMTNKKTMQKIIQNLSIDPDLLYCMPTNSRAVKGDFEVHSFASSHDSVESVGYVINTDKVKIGVLTDTGIVNDDMKQNIYDCNALVLEANHDVNMLKNGFYPPNLKSRILGDCGHLSNLQCAEALCSMSSNITNVFLAHLSKENNSPELAYDTVTSILHNNNIKKEDMYIEVAPRDRHSSVLEF